MKIISEIGINHNGDFRKIEELVRQSAEQIMQSFNFTILLEFLEMILESIMNLLLTKFA